MPTIINPASLPSPPEQAPNRIRWKRAQCEAMREAGILTGQYELIDGEIISKTGQKPRHSLVVRLVMAWLSRVFGVERVAVQVTLDLSAAIPEYDEPEPDVFVTKEPESAYSERHPTPSDLLLLAEVSDTTLRFDLTTKAAHYALAGVPEYWVIDILGRQIIVHRQPGPSGYSEITAYSAAESLTAIALPDQPVTVSELMPPD